MARSEVTWTIAALLAALSSMAVTTSAQAPAGTVLCPLEPDGDARMLLVQADRLYAQRRDERALALFEAALLHPACHFAFEDSDDRDDALGILEGLEAPGAEPGWFSAGTWVGTTAAVLGLLAATTSLALSDSISRDATDAIMTTTFIVGGTMLLTSLVLNVIGLVRNAKPEIRRFDERRGALVDHLRAGAR